MVGLVALDWGIKKTFRDYFEQLSDHSYELTEGAQLNDDSEISFAFAPDSKEEKLVKFRGRVRLTGHSGALQIQIANPIVEFGTGKSATLSAEVDEYQGEPVRMIIANLEQLSASPSLKFRVELAKEGEYLFFGKYFEGEEMAPLTMR